MTAGRLLELLIRGSANASATIANVFDNAGGNQTASGTPTTTTMSVAGTPWTTNQWAGYYVTITNAGDTTNFNLSRLIASNTNNTLTFAAFPGTPLGATAFVIGNYWAAVPGQAWTADGGVATSHAQWWRAANASSFATGIIAASASAATITVVWAGGNTANTLSLLEVSGADTTTPETAGAAASGTGATPTCSSFSPSSSGILVAGFACPTTAQTYSSPLDNAAGNAMTITLPAAGTSRAAVATLAKGSGGTFSPRITQSTSEGWVAIPLMINDPASTYDPSTVPWRTNDLPVPGLAVAGF